MTRSNPRKFDGAAIDFRAFAQAQWNTYAALHRLMELAFARLPVGVWVGVNHHKLNGLFGVVDGMKFSVFLQKFGYFVGGEASAYGLFKTNKNVTVPAGVTAKGTWVCFAGPGQTTNPLNRGVPFALIGDGQLPMLADTTDTAQARIARLLQRGVVLQNAG